MFFDCHLMVINTKFIINKLNFVDRISIHIENTNVLENINYIKSMNLNFGIVINPDTPIEIIDKYIYLFNENDIIQIMTVYPGNCGQIFLKDQLKKIKYIKDKYPTINIQVDGGINLNTIDSCIKTGATSFVCGSSMIKEGIHIKDKIHTSIVQRLLAAKQTNASVKVKLTDLVRKSIALHNTPVSSKESHTPSKSSIKLSIGHAACK